MERIAALVELEHILSEEAARFGLVNAQIACRLDGTLKTDAVGRRRTSEEPSVDTDTIMQIGSSGKMLAAALLLRLSDDGEIDLDAPVRNVLPGFRVADSGASARITPRHLLSHTAGFDGDWFEDTGDGPDAIEHYVETLGHLEQVFLPGTAHNYSNAGFVVISRLTEVLTGLPWSEALIEHLAKPLGLDGLRLTAKGLPSGTNVSFGHDMEGVPLPPLATRSMAPAGAGLLGRAEDLARFVWKLPDYLAPDTFAAMRKRQIAGPCWTFASAWGLGMMIYDWTNGVELYGHNGAVPGQFTFVRAHEPTGTIVALIGSGGDVAGFATAVLRRVMSPSIGGEPMPIPKPLEHFPGNPESYTGVYALSSCRLTVTSQNGLSVKCEPVGVDTDVVPAFTVSLAPVDRELMLAKFPGRVGALLQRFMNFDEKGRPQRLNFRGRVFPRQSE